MQRLIVALEADFCTIYYLQDKQELQIGGATLNMNANGKNFKWDSIVWIIASWAHHKGFPKIKPIISIKIRSSCSLSCHQPLSFLWDFWFSFCEGEETRGGELILSPIRADLLSLSQDWLPPALIVLPHSQLDWLKPPTFPVLQCSVIVAGKHRGRNQEGCAFAICTCQL